MSTKGPLGYTLPTPAEDERLDLLIGECAEVIQAAIKCKRFGYGSHHPNGGPSNQLLLETELGHVDTAIALLYAHGDVSMANVNAAGDVKQATLHQWLVRQGDPT